MDKRPATADLQDPLYYLKNMQTLVDWVLTHHRDLLTRQEQARLAGFSTLSVPARALLTRLVMRTGELFRTDKLRYPELGGPECEALADLLAEGWLEASPKLSLDDLFRLFTLAELRQGLAPVLQQAGLAASLPKGRLLEGLQPLYPKAQPLEQWLARPKAKVVQLQGMALFDRVRLMFFGNLRQNWSDFVLVELGLQRFEPVPFTPDARAFQCREQVDCYLQMHHCREWLDAGATPREVWQAVPGPVDNPWLSSRRDRLLLELGRQADRQGDPELALQAWAASGHRQAMLKRLRLLERLKRYPQAWQLACQWQTGELSDAEAQGLARVLKRLAPKVGAERPRPVDNLPLQEHRLNLPKPATGSVELAVLNALATAEAPVFYVENTLINGLFGLLCWPVIFQPMPGAFFHPFHTGPADLTREDFVSRRQSAFEARLTLLQTGDHHQPILDTFRAKQGIANPFVVWSVLNEPLLQLALACIPANHLECLFRRLLQNIKEHRSGFPDLIRFLPTAESPERRYEMIEVKGPGDRLQDHQIRWLTFFAKQGIPASVCYLRWQEGAGVAE